MDEQKTVEVAEPRFEHGHFLLIAGLGGRFTQDTTAGIPELWEKFIPEIGNIPGQKDEVTYGICCNPDGKGGFEYIAGVEISKLDDLPEKYRWVEVQPQQYAVFEHKGSLDRLPQTFQYIWKTWLPGSGREAADAPEFERYSADFNPTRHTGLLEIWLPLKPQ
ncbi:MULTISPECIES: GyrI-like domain-containing protein [unclassified Pseudomonas]|jgi:AraC family transcriptional regulator|uniref:GyrI-like domain-containing protein n=1 Tax=unclassified Pseudomonas TaxID=196821 RepID=UPI000F079054|nr:MULTISPECIES: GyrI-like domain-containing protein [unclassified Pseudomonas]MCA4962483.1 AraC family transcriptional regulator [Pseudomonas sp. Y24-6]MCH4879219.1 AraC family transcriptional regulator [Pseudomonas sp. TMW22090]